DQLRGPGEVAIDPHPAARIERHAVGVHAHVEELPPAAAVPGHLLRPAEHYPPPPLRVDLNGPGTCIRDGNFHCREMAGGWVQQVHGTAEHPGDDYLPRRIDGEVMRKVLGRREKVFGNARMGRGVPHLRYSARERCREPGGRGLRTLSRGNDGKPARWAGKAEHAVDGAGPFRMRAGPPQPSRHARVELVTTGAVDDELTLGGTIRKECEPFRAGRLRARAGYHRGG